MSLLARKHTSEEAEALDGEIRAIDSEYQQVRAGIRKANPHYAALTQPEPLSAAQIQEMIDPDTMLLEYNLGEEHSYAWAVTTAMLASFELPPRVEIERAARRFYKLLTSRNERKIGETPVQRQRRIRRADTELVECAQSLGQQTLGAVAGSLGRKRLLIVADGALQYIPFQSLQSPAADPRMGSPIVQKPSKIDHETDSFVVPRSGGVSTLAYRPLMLDHEIVSLPSASALAVMRREAQGRPSAPKAVAVLADPVFTADDPRVERSVRRRISVRASVSVVRGRFTGPPLVRERDAERSLRDVGLAENAIRIPRLPLAHEEAESILSLVPESERLGALNFEASKAAASDPKLAQYRILHFATHGLLNSIHPELSGLVLSLVDQNGRPQDGFFRLHEIYNLNLPADLVVLSACQTGLGKEIRGEGLVGLTRGFMYAGAKSVVASLWKIDDRATAALMKRFYEGMLGPARLAPAESLRKAQIEMWRTANWSHPSYWAAFVLQGEWK
jgi:CHAT domain-containing protein